MPVYISKEGLEDLRTELVKRKKITRREIAERISVAKELGDLSENFEYHEAKEQQALNEARVNQLEAMIVDALIVEESTGGDVVGLGCTFVVELNGKDKTFMMVGSAEANPLDGKISNDSPLGAAFMGKVTGDSVKVEVPYGKMTYKIKKIK